MKWLLLSYIALQALDITTTAVNLHRGCQELVWPNAQTAYAAKGGSIAVTITLHHKGYTGPEKAVEIVGIGQGAFGTIWNLHQSCQ